MLKPWKLPTSLNIGGVDFEIRTDYRDILHIITAFEDSDLYDWMKQNILLVVLYKEWRKIPVDNVMEALEKGLEFINYGQKKSSSLKIMDWEQDATMIVSEINKISNIQDIRMVEYMHWWTFVGYYMGIGEGLYSQVLQIRSKKLQGKKLEKWESEFYNKNKAICDITRKTSIEEQKKRKAERQAVDALFY